MEDLRFEAIPVAESGGWLRIDLPRPPAEVWGERDRYHITGSVAGFRIRGPLAEDGSLRLGPAWLREIQMPEGPVEVVLSPEGPQLEGLDEDLREALRASPAATASFTSLATFYRKGYLKWLAGAKRRPEARRERVREWIELLEAGEKTRPQPLSPRRPAD
jgi:hypothetical protein